MTSNLLTRGVPGLQLARLTGPMVLGVSASIIVQLIEAVWIALLGTAHLAAYSFTFPVVMGLTSIALGIGIGTSSVIARSVGANQSDAARRIGFHALLIVAATAVSLSLLLTLSIEPLFTLLGASPTTIDLLTPYLIVYLSGSVLFTLTMVASNIMRANGQAALPGLVMTGAALAHLLIDPFLIFGWWIAPELGLEGAAWAFLVTRVASTALLLWVVVKRGLIDPHAKLSGLANSTKQILQVGAPAALTQLIGPVSAGVITGLLATSGEEVVAGFGVAVRVEAVAVMVLFALSGSIGPFVGQNYGAKAYDRVTAGMRTSYVFSLCWGAVMAVLLYLLAPIIIPLVEGDATAQRVAITYLSIAPIGYGAWGVLMMASASFNALGKPIPSTILSFVRMFIVYLPLALLLERFMDFRGVFLASMITNIALSLVAFMWFRHWFATSTSSTTR